MIGLLSRAFRWVLYGMVRGYQIALGWALGGHCRFYPSCSVYALDALERRGFFRAVGLILWRLARCQPFCKGGLDPVAYEPGEERDYLRLNTCCQHTEPPPE